MCLRKGPKKRQEGNRCEDMNEFSAGPKGLATASHLRATLAGVQPRSHGSSLVTVTAHRLCDLSYRAH